MKIAYILFLIFASLLLSSKVIAQEYEYPKMISLKVLQNKRFYNSHTEIYITKQADSCNIEIAVSPTHDSNEIFRKMDTAFSIPPNLFNELKSLITSFSNIDMDKALLIGHDGEFTTIKYGLPGSLVEYEFWSPNVDTKKRGLTDFLQTVYKIIETAHLQPKEIL